MKKYVIAVVSILFLLCAGCGRKPEAPVQVEPENKVDWKTTGFQITDDIKIEQSLWSGEYVPWEHSTLDSDYERVGHLESGVCQNLMWYLGYGVKEGVRVFGVQGQYVLEIYDTVSKEYQVKYFTPAELGLIGELGFIVGMDMIGPGSYMFRWAGYTQDEEEMVTQTADIIVFTDLAGKNRIVDVYSTFLEEEIEAYEPEIMPSWPYEKCHTDGKGNIWLVKSKKFGGFVFYLWDENGQKIMEYESDKDMIVTDSLRTDEGDLLLTVFSNTESSYEFLWIDDEQGKVVPVAKRQTQGPVISQVYGLYGNNLYYRMVNPETRNGEGLVKWNIGSGEETWVYEFQINGLNNYRTMLSCDESQQLTLRLLKTKDTVKDWIIPLVENPPEEEGAIRVVDLAGKGGIIEIGASEASMEHPKLRFTYEDASAEEKRTRVLAELTQGEGPDILFVNMEDYATLADKGVLLDIKPMLSQELRNQLLPAVLEIGKRNGQLLGMPVGVNVEAFAIKAGKLQNSADTLEKLISLMNAGDLTAALRSPYIMTDYLDPELTVCSLIRYSLSNSFLIDWEKGISHFNDERFVQLLELTKEDMSRNVTGEWQEKDLVWAYIFIENDLVDFVTHLEKADMELIGPEGSVGNGYLSPDGGLLVINKNSTNKEAAMLYLEVLLGREVQTEVNKLCLRVRKMVPEEDSEELLKAKEFLESCQVEPPTYTHISRIIAEELNTMYKENREAEEIAENIHRRVQLYLDEGR